ncbi:helix-turn-helix domain-containing protein [Paenibacillus donghaensis]|uniref:helix-turn-helix domain-containing protein n=1 Tax=Paenibacillus TaxID=44249 RepID=UPI0018834B3A|nr:helix-turn-helix domain-containing protein [Paenibacillus donghaensis]MBE9916353.1 helix-turn-helix domain-containing protein [Paenibacillus donghaensis]
MDATELFDLVSQAKNGDKAAIESIIQLFQPAIQKACRRTKPQERRDLEQHMSEKIIRAVYSYDIDSIPDYSRFVKVLSDSDR